MTNVCPGRKCQVDPETRPYWNIKEEISVNGDLLLRKDRLIVPTSLRKVKYTAATWGSGGAKKELEVSWFGQERMIKLQTWYQSVTLVTRTEIRKQENQWKVMNYLSDHGRRLLFELERQNYLIIVDYYSKFFELLHFPNINGKTVINFVKSHSRIWQLWVWNVCRTLLI